MLRKSSDNQIYHKEIKSYEIVPGDIFEIANGSTIPCDCIILEGECIVNEAMLTGESISILKVPLPKNPNSFYNVDSDK